MKWSLGLLIAAAASGVAVASWMRARSAQPIEVAGVAVTRGPISAHLKASGLVQAPQSFTVATPQAGRLLQLKRRLGESVRRGEVLAQLDNAPATEHLRNTEALLEAQEVQVRQAELDLQAEEKIWRAGGQARQAVERAESRLAGARAQREAARSDVRAARLQVSVSVVTAPADGIVTAVAAHAGEFLPAGSPLLSLASLGSLEVRIKVDQGSADRIQTGQQVELSSQGAPDRLGNSVIARIEPKLEKEGASHYLVAIAALPDKGFGARLNQLLTVRVLTEARPQALRLPLDAVTERDGVDVVRVVEEGRLRLKRVRTGIQDGRQVEIVEGLAEGQKVVLPNAKQVLAEGTPVRFTGNGQP
jgi:RND family efflux transporter MFP subunit